MKSFLKSSMDQINKTMNNNNTNTSPNNNYQQQYPPPQPGQQQQHAPYNSAPASQGSYPPQHPSVPNNYPPPAYQQPGSASSSTSGPGYSSYPPSQPQPPVSNSVPFNTSNYQHHHQQPPMANSVPYQQQPPRTNGKSNYPHSQQQQQTMAHSVPFNNDNYQHQQQQPQQPYPTSAPVNNGAHQPPTSNQYGNFQTGAPQSNTPAYWGPYLKYVNCGFGHWQGSCLIVGFNPAAPILSVRSPLQKEPTTFTALQLPNHTPLREVYFWRFDINIPQDQNGTKRVEYWINIDPSKIYNFHIPGINEEYLNWMFYSCNGISLSVSQEERQKMNFCKPLWQDFLNSHKFQRPFHCMVGGGDQVYADRVWQDSPELVKWLAIKGKEPRYKHPWNSQAEYECAKFYFDLYIENWSRDPLVAEIMASVPSVNIMDDHDIWDGYGSYPESLTKSNVWVNLGRIALYFFAVFQLHTTPEMAHQDHYFGGRGAYNHIRMLGTKTAVVMVDARTERTLDQVVSQQTWEMLRNELYKIPQSTKHVVFVTGVPIVHPRLVTADHVNAGFGDLKRGVNGAANMVGNALPFLKPTLENAKHAVGKDGLCKSLINQFGLPELSDDLNDHWTFKTHTRERMLMIQMLQAVARDKRVRVTLVGGDVHLAATGRFFSKAQPNSLDYRLMYQITSSAIGNVAPPALVVKNSNISSKDEYDLDPETREQMIMLFVKDVDGSPSNSYCLGRRNYCVVDSKGNDNLDFCIRVESNVKGQQAIGYTLSVPPPAM